MAYKVFTNGSTLQASELNENLMQQSIAVFSNAAARTAAITSPVEGQMTYLEDVDRFQWWSGSAWRSPFGMTLLSQFAMNGTTIDFTNVFTSEFDNYRIIFQNTKVATGAAFTRLRMLNGSTPETTAGAYVYSGWLSNYLSSSLTAVQGGGSSAEMFIGEWSNTGRFTVLDIITPNVANFTGFALDTYGGAGSLGVNGLHAINSAYNGIRIFADGGGTITGTARIYGYRNA